MHKWEQALLNPKLRPNPVLYRWLRGESPATVLGVESHDGPSLSLDDVFRAHRHYWQQICSGPASQSTPPVPSDEDLPLSAQDTLDVLPRVKKVLPLGWTFGRPKRLCICHEELLRFWRPSFEALRPQEDGPNRLLRVKITLIGKAGLTGQLPSHWRPLGITSVWYRLYAQARLPTLLKHLLPTLPPTVLGGIPGRNPSEAILNLLTAFESHATGRPSHPLYGVWLWIASKCFDRVKLDDLWQHLRTKNVPATLCNSMQNFYAQHVRHTVIRGHLDPTPWSITTGLLQGCPLSVMATVSLVAEWHHCMPDHTIALVHPDFCLSPPGSRILQIPADNKLILEAYKVGLRRLCWNKPSHSGHIFRDS